MNNMNNQSTFKSGFVSIIGRPNVGKSTLLNQILKHKLAIVTPKAQTTRNKIQGIYTTDSEQIIFVDTPGIHRPLHELGENMNKMAFSAIEGMDVIIWLVDGTLKPNELDLKIVESLKKTTIPVLLAINKVDLVKTPEEIEEMIDSYKQLFPFDGGITISAKANHNVDILIKMVTQRLSVGPKYYPEDQLIDQPERFVVAELIREKVLLCTDEEVPHSVAVTIDSFKQNTNKPNLIDIHATIIVERSSQKKIVIGAGGAMIKKIGTLARKDIVEFLGSKIYLELFVKVEADWRNKKSQLKEYGYSNDQY